MGWEGARSGGSAGAARVAGDVRGIFILTIPTPRHCHDNWQRHDPAFHGKGYDAADVELARAANEFFKRNDHLFILVRTGCGVRGDPPVRANMRARRHDISASPRA